MICFRDRTFCISPNCVNACGRKLTEEVREAAQKWWGNDVGEPPICVSYYCGGSFEDTTA